jgi:hypothetical protein
VFNRSLQLALHRVSAADAPATEELHCSPLCMLASANYWAAQIDRLLTAEH